MSNIILTITKKERDKVVKQISRIQSELNNDPHIEFANIQLGFKDFLNKFKGEGRSSAEATAIVKQMDQKEKQCRARMKTYDYLKLLRKLNDKKSILDELELEIARIEYRAKH